MTHARCCGCGGDGGYDCQNPPSCIDLELSGVVHLPACDTATSRAAGYIGSFRLQEQMFPGSMSYGGEFAGMFRVAFSSSEVYISRKISVSVQLGCRGANPGELVVGQIQVSPIDWDTFPFGVRTNIFRSSPGLADAPGIGGVSDNLLEPICDRNTYGMFSGGSARVTIPAGCDIMPDHVIARHCEGILAPIVVDLGTMPSNVDALNPIIGDDIYELGAERVTDQAIATGWTEESCQDDQGDNRIAVRCFGTERIAWDPSTLTAFARTCVYQGKRYKLTTETTTDQAVAVEFSRRSCQGFDGPNCGGIRGPDDPRCDLPEYAICPNCFDGTQVDPPTGPGTIIAPDDPDDPGLPGLGDMVEVVLKRMRLDKLARPGRCGCQRRKEILNEYGQRYGRAIIKLLGL